MVMAGRERTVQYNTIKVRLYPDQKQAELFQKTFGCCRYIWNRMLAGHERFDYLLHEHIANQRRDFLHKESRRIANAWDAVCIRGDDLKAISEELGGSSVRDTGFGMFRELLRYKLERQGKQMLEVDRFTPTTKVCSACGCVNETLDPDARQWLCPVCGTIHDRDVNAAINIKTQGLELYRMAQTAS